MFLSGKTEEPCCLISVLIIWEFAALKFCLKKLYKGLDCVFSWPSDLQQQITCIFIPQELLSYLIWGDQYDAWLEDHSIPINLAQEHLHHVTQAFSFLETLLIQSELCKNAENLVNQMHYIFLSFTVEANIFTLQIKVLGCLFISAFYSLVLIRVGAAQQSTGWIPEYLPSILRLIIQ